MPVQKDIHMHEELVKNLKLWLYDSVGHAVGLAAFLDPDETLLSCETMEYRKKFDMLPSKEKISMCR